MIPHPLRRLWAWVADRVLPPDAVATRAPFPTGPTGALLTGDPGTTWERVDWPLRLPVLRDRRGSGSR